MIHFPGVVLVGLCNCIITPLNTSQGLRIIHANPVTYYEAELSLSSEGINEPIESRLSSKYLPSISGGKRADLSILT